MSESNDRLLREHPVVGRCIYCGTTDNLTDEHTVPYSLNGALMLKKASCRACADITSRFERSVSRDALEVGRAVMQYNTRHPGRRSETYPVKVVIDGEVQSVQMPVEVVAALVPMVDLGFPSYLIDKYSLGPEFRRDYRHTISKTVSRNWAGTKAYLESIGAESLSAKASFDSYEFVRMLAKIAYCETIAVLILNGYPGLDSIKENFVLDFIRNGGEPPWQYIGGEPPAAPSEDRSNPDYRAVTFKDGDIIAYIQLFAQLGGPLYCVVVGRATDELREWMRSEGADDA